MTLYVDSSALIKRYVAEDDSEEADAILLSDTEWVTGRHTYVEVGLAIHRRLGETERRLATTAFERDWQRTFVVALDLPGSGTRRQESPAWRVPAQRIHRLRR